MACLNARTANTGAGVSGGSIYPVVSGSSQGQRVGIRYIIACGTQPTLRDLRHLFAGKPMKHLWNCDQCLRGYCMIFTSMHSDRMRDGDRARLGG